MGAPDRRCADWHTDGQANHNSGVNPTSGDLADLDGYHSRAPGHVGHPWRSFYDWHDDGCHNQVGVLLEPGRYNRSAGPLDDSTDDPAPTSANQPWSALLK